MFPILPGSAEAKVILGGIVKHLLIAYLSSNISTKKYQNPFTCVKVIASQLQRCTDKLISRVYAE